jgi:hypothetical protein
MQIRNCAPKLHKKRELAKVYATILPYLTILNPNWSLERISSFFLTDLGLKE